MEGGSSDGEKHPPGDEPKIKRKMKTASQLQALENTYKVGAYPSEALREELSVQLGLTDRQLQMWFCHRRLKDRKASASVSASVSASGSAKKRARKGGALPVTVAAPPPVADDEMLDAELGSSPYGSMDPRRSSGLSGRVRHYEPPAQSIDELRAIEFVEAQLGEPLREDGPAFGVEFDPLPPGAFGDSIGALMSPPRSAGRLYERSDTKPVKDSGRARNEYQFLLEHPTVRSDSYERVAQTHYYSSPSHARASKTPLLSSGRSYVHGYEEVPVAYGTSSHTPNLSLIAQLGKTGGPSPSAYGDHGSVGWESPRTSMARESPYSAHPVTRLENSVMPSEVCVTLEEDERRVEMNNKSDGAGTAKEFDTQEKRMRRELEKHDILRRKREECMKKELERLDREHKKEEERLLREKQREEERYQREQKREMERREKFLLKESIRLEKLRQKEELRIEREVARQKAANDRAVTRRLAKESMELIEDERLELMEIAASRKSLSSIVSLDSETLQNLDSYRDMLRVFPPISVQLKNPFAIQPWTDSEENVGNLLMVWRFLITFADVLGMWPFTLDEFMQAFHDYDPRLLGEIHVALIKTIIKDIQDVSRTPSIGLGANQTSASNPGGGGHCQIVEGAYTWGFDICSWKHNLSLLTWPEVLRQLALSAGFGPKLKKREVEQACARFDIDGDDGMDVVSDLRNGEAVENAVAKMRERGYSNPRRSRHRLTPGTVKFAAFYVLALEGSRGLNILEVADKIQKSGLRDLTTSKTPEASVAAALSRDTKLFQRTAPSTYCLKSPYRKDPVDAEAILSAAREKVRAFKSGFVDGVEADVDVVEANDVETKEDSESDTAEDPEVDDLGADQTPNIGVDASYDMNTCEPQVHLGNGIGNLHAKTVGNTVDGLVNVGEGLSSSVLEGFKDHEDTDIDESYPGELWVQGLMECEYSNLSVEERLNALVALVGVATEGNSIRSILEERLEAATSMKKQMWAEAQLDKRRLKDEYMMKLPYTPILINKTEANTLDCNSRPSAGLVPCEMNNDNNAHTDMSSDKNLPNPSFAVCSDSLTLQQSVYTTERSRAQLKSYIGHRAEEMYTYRSLPLGQDRRHNRYWQFIASASCNDPGAGRIFVELHNGGWRLIDSEEAFDAFLSSLDVRGVRESHLHALLQKIQPLFKETIGGKKKLVKIEVSEGGLDSPSSTVCAPNSETPKPSSSFHIESGRNILEVKNALKRYKSFEEWMWRECSSSVLRASKYGKKRSTQLLCVCDSCHDVYFYKDNHCAACHKNFDSCNKNFDFPGHITQCEKIKVNETSHRFDYPPARLRLLKALVAQVEVCIPPEALEPVWSESNRESWGVKLHMSSLAKELLQVLTLLEGAIRRDFMSSNFKSTVELLAFDNGVKDASGFSGVTVLPWIPHTTSAVALRLMELDSAIYYIPDQKIENEKDAQAPQFINLPSDKYTVGNIQADVSAVLEDAWVESMHGARGRGRAGPRTRGGRSQGGRRRSLASNMKHGKGGRRKGRRSTTQKRVKEIPTVATHESGFPTPIMFDNDSSPPGFSGRDIRQIDANDNSNSERSDYSNEYEDMSIDNGKPEHNLLIDRDRYDDGDEDHDDGGDYDDDEEELDEVQNEMGEDYVDGSRKYKEQTEGYLNGDEDVGDGDANQDYSSVSGSSTDYTSD